jgi:hypothetical protein
MKMKFVIIGRSDGFSDRPNFGGKRISMPRARKKSMSPGIVIRTEIPLPEF